MLPVIWKSNLLGKGPSTALSIEMVLCPEAKVKDLTSTRVMSYLALAFSNALECASNMLGDDLTFFTYRVASRNWNLTLGSATVLSR